MYLFWTLQGSTIVSFTDKRIFVNNEDRARFRVYLIV